MSISHIYHTTSPKETLEPHVYVDRYADIQTRNLIHKYKFTGDAHSKSTLMVKTLDLCLDTHLHDTYSKRNTIYMYTSPPSTMFERGEKSVDSMFELIRSAGNKFSQYMCTSTQPPIFVCKIFTIRTKHLTEKRAQHIDGSRKSRVKNLEHRYYISLKHRIYIWYYIHIRKITRVSYHIVDDVSSTGATLVACRLSLLAHLNQIQKKNPHISFDVRIFSLCH